MDKTLLAEKAQAPTLAANDARQPLAAVPHDDDAAFALHAAITELLSPVPEIDQGGTSCSRLAYHAVGLLNDADKSDDAQWVNSVCDVEAMLRGALGCGDGVSSQHTLLSAALQKVWALYSLLDAGRGGKPFSGAPAAAEAEAEEPPLVVTQERRSLGLDACYQADGLGNVLADMCDRIATTDDSELARDYLAALKPLAKRMRKLTCIAMSVLDDDDTVEGLTERLEGSAS